MSSPKRSRIAFASASISRLVTISAKVQNVCHFPGPALGNTGAGFQRRGFKLLPPSVSENAMRYLSELGRLHLRYDSRLRRISTSAGSRIPCVEAVKEVRALRIG
jgi:hypothetical protein